MLRARTATDFGPEDIGYLTQPVRFGDWIEVVRESYAFLSDVDADEARFLMCNARDLYAVETALGGFDH